MLPLVRSIVGGMMDDHTERQGVLERLGKTDAAEEIEELEREARQLTEKLIEAGNELSELGVELKGIDLGLVDFPTLRNGQLVYLCWHYGEDRIEYWHPLETGYAGRQPIGRD